MKRIGLLFLAALVSVASFAQTDPGADIDALGTDFETLVEQIGLEIQPNMQQLGIWGQFPGQAVLPEESRFFFSMSLGAGLGFDGILGFAAEEDNPAFELLDVGGLINTILSVDPTATAGSALESIQSFFPYPVARTAFGFALPADLEVMLDFAIFPQFLANTATNLVEAVPPFELNALHLGGRLRRQILSDAPGIPAISVGAGYSYSGFNLAYDLTQIGTVETDIGTLNIAGELYLRNRIHSLGLDVHVSKNLGFFVPFIGLSPYYQFSGFSGGIGPTDADFDAYIDFESTAETRDVEYDGARPDTTLVDNDLALVLFGGFDLVFGRTALEIHAAYSIGEAWPAVSLGVRRQ